jgi:hypothetical protein
MLAAPLSSLLRARRPCARSRPCARADPAALAPTAPASSLQLESVVYATQRHEGARLADGRRKGFFIGDGAGIGACDLLVL